MLLGAAIGPFALIAGGVMIFALLVFQILLGERKIKIKGPLHRKVHRWVAYALAFVAGFHALAALAYLEII